VSISVNFPISVNQRVRNRISVNKCLEGEQNTTPWESSIRPLSIWVYRNSVQKRGSEERCNFWSLWPKKNCLCNFSRIGKLHNEHNLLHKSFRDECFGILRGQASFLLQRAQKDTENRGRLTFTKISFFEPIFSSNGLKKHEFRLTLIGKLTLIDTKRNFAIFQTVPRC